jgi:hypothetical protein
MLVHELNPNVIDAGLPGPYIAGVEAQGGGFALISRKPRPEDPRTCVEVRFIKVKGRAAIGEIALTSNEYKAVARLKKDYWLYAVFSCAAARRASDSRPQSDGVGTDR